MSSYLNPTTVILLFLAVFLIESIAQVLNLKLSREPLPSALRDVQSSEEQTRASRYLKDRIIVSGLKDAVFLMIFIFLLLTGFFGTLQLYLDHVSNSHLVQALLYAALLGLGQGLLGLPFEAYSTFTIESKYGFNRTTPGTFIGDRVKGLIIGAVLGGALFSFIFHMFEHHGDQAWWMIWIGYTAFQFFIVWIAPVALLPLFLKLSPLPEGSLKNAIDGYSRKQSFKLDGAWVCDASKRSAKSNAFFTGFGKFRRLVLFDTLIEKHPEAEITAIVAHEAGHFKLGHIWKGSLFSAFSSLLFFLVIQMLIHTEALYHAFGASPGNVGVGLVFSAILLTKVSYFFSPLSAYFSRRNEYAADRFSVATTGDAASLISGLKRLVSHNLSTLQHHPLYVILHDSHPPLPKRIAALDNPNQS